MVFKLKCFSILNLIMKIFNRDLDDFDDPERKKKEKEEKEKEEKKKEQEKFAEKLREREIDADMLVNILEDGKEDRYLEKMIKKAKTGDRRLNDLLLGGFPLGSNILIYGPPFTGKEVSMNCFTAKSLKIGIPCIYILTDKLVSEAREEMAFVMSDYKNYEDAGLIHYIDAYSKSVGIGDEEPGVIYIDDCDDHLKLISEETRGIIEGLSEDFESYRVIFRSLSTPIAYLNDIGKVLKPLNSITAKVKYDNAIGLYALEKGMHDEMDIQAVGSIMDGMIDYKVEQLKTFLCIKGIGDVQSRAWIDYTYSKQGLSIGSFCLDHIK